MSAPDLEQLARDLRASMCPPARRRVDGDGWDELPQWARAPWLAQAAALVRLARSAA